MVSTGEKKSNPGYHFIESCLLKSDILAKSRSYDVILRSVGKELRTENRRLLTVSINEQVISDHTEITPTFQDDRTQVSFDFVQCIDQGIRMEAVLKISTRTSSVEKAVIKLCTIRRAW